MTEEEKIKKAFMRYVSGKAKNDKYLKKKLNFDNQCFAEQVLPESIQRELIKDIEQKEGENK